MSFFFKVASWTPIGSYNVSQPFRRRSIVVCLALLSLIAYAGLTAWNVLTQGKVNTYTSIVSTEYLSTDNTSCSPALVEVGSLLYTRPTGTFNWIIQGIDNGVPDQFATALQYTGAGMTANITSFGLTYSFAQQSFKYGICANATFNSPVKHNGALNIDQSQTMVISLCTDFDLSTANLPPWTAAGQQTIQNSVFGISQYFQMLSLPNGTFPSQLFPPYGQPSTSPPITDTTITPDKVIDVSMWMNGFIYLPSTSGNTSHDVVLPGSDTVLNLTQAFQQTSSSGNGPSGFLLALTGIGGLLLEETTGEPPVITYMRSYMIASGNTMMDLASTDLNNRTLGASYLCTIKGSQWKPILTLISVILGNNAGLFAGILAGLVAVATLFDTSSYREVEQERVALNPPYTPRHYQEGPGYTLPYTPQRYQDGPGQTPYYK